MKLSMRKFAPLSRWEVWELGDWASPLPNRALLWRYEITLWKRVVHLECGEGRGGCTTSRVSVAEATKWVGMGGGSFWQAVWCRDVPLKDSLPESHSTAVNKTATIVDYIK